MGKEERLLLCGAGKQFLAERQYSSADTHQGALGWTWNPERCGWGTTDTSPRICDWVQEGDLPPTVRPSLRGEVGWGRPNKRHTAGRAGSVSPRSPATPGWPGRASGAAGRAAWTPRGTPPALPPPPCHNRMMPPSHPVGGGLSHHCTAQGKFLLRQTAPKQHFE